MTRIELDQILTGVPNTDKGTNKWHVSTFIADRPIRSLKDKIHVLTRWTSQQDPATVLIRLNQIIRDWSSLSNTPRAKAHSVACPTSCGGA